MDNITSSVSGKNVWALLVGIDYVNTSHRLSGCVNDINAMKRFLVEQMGVPEAQIKMLADKQAKRAAIINAFSAFLINNEAIPSGAQILFHYSGHGAQMPSRSKFEPDGRDETIVAYDSRTEGVYDIPDKTLGGLIDALAAKKGNNITVVLDCCHSGSGTRALPDAKAAKLITRRLAFDPRQPPADLDAEWYRLPTEAITTPNSTRSLGPSGWELADKTHVLLAGCRASEESHEHRVAGGDATVQGALTYFMLDWLRSMPAGASGATYGDLHEAVSARVNAIYRDQMPQCEGDRNRQLFGGVRVQRDPFAKVTAVDGTTLTLDCGATQGMQLDTTLAIYPASVKTLQDCKTRPPIAHAKLSQVGGTSSKATLTDAPSEPVLANCRVVIIKRGVAGTRATVWLGELAAGPKKGLADRVKQSDLLAQSKSKNSADVIVQADASAQYHLFDLSGRELCETSADADDVFGKLEHMARFRLVQQLRNESETQLQIKATLCKYDPDTKQTSKLERDAGGELVLSHSEGGSKFNRYVLQIENTSTVPVFVNMFYLEGNFSVTARYPKQGEPEQIAAKDTWTYGLDEKNKLLIGLHANEESTCDQLKVIATSQPAEFQLLAQDALKPAARNTAKSIDGSSESALQRLIRSKTSATRGQLDDDEVTAIDDDWTTADVIFHVERASASENLTQGVLTQPLKVGKVVITKKPAALTGSISVEPFEADARRSIGQGIVLPPALTNRPDLCQLLAAPGTRSVGNAGLVVKINADDATRAAVTPTSPLVLDVSAIDPDADLVAVTHDGEDFLIVGSGVNGTVNLLSLPEDKARTRANITRSLRLFLFKSIGQRAPELGLHYFERGSDVSKPRLPKPADFKAGETVALMVHGFLSDTGWMADGVASFLRQSVKDYDHVIGWDYETIGTGVSANGLGLANALRSQCGFAANDGITVHVFAHSMGCLVSRCMIDLHGGSDFVDKAVLAGPPNLGTKAADASKGLAYVFNLLLNNVITIPGPGWLGKVLTLGFGWVLDHTEGWDDLKTSSTIVIDINALTAPTKVPYLVLAGLNSAVDGAAAQGKRIAAKMIDTGLDAFYGEDNDTVIGKHCMTDLRNGNYPPALLTVQTLGCDHGGYYSDVQGREVIEGWVKAG